VKEGQRGIDLFGQSHRREVGLAGGRGAGDGGAGAGEYLAKSRSFEGEPLSFGWPAG